MPATPSLTQRAFGLARRKAGGRLKRGVRRVAGRPLVAWERRSLRPVLTVVMPVYNVAEYLPVTFFGVLFLAAEGLRFNNVMNAGEGEPETVPDSPGRSITPVS